MQPEKIDLAYRKIGFQNISHTYVCISYIIKDIIYKFIILNMQESSNCDYLFVSYKAQGCAKY